MRGQLNKALVKKCLKTFASFLGWIPLGYIFETDIIEKLLEHFFTIPTFRNDTLPWLVEITGLKIDETDPKYNEYMEKQYILFISFIDNAVTVTMGKDLSNEHKLVTETQKPHFEIFCLQVGMLISEFLKNQISKIENLIVNNPNDFTRTLQAALEKSLEFLIQLSNIPEGEVFKITMDFWHDFTYYIMVSTKGKALFSKTGDQSLINLQQNDLLLKNSELRTKVFPTACKLICECIIDNMAKPEEVLVVIDENGNAVEEQYRDTETLTLYNTMRANLVYLTNIDSNMVYKIMTSKLSFLLANESNFTFDALNKLWWGLGSISECMQEEEENKFVVTVIKELLNLVEKKKGKNNKALVAADIMYVVGQFPRFLITHWAFLKTVIKKLNEFMHEKHPGVQDMATEVFLKISKKTKHMFVKSHENEEPYVHHLIRTLKENTSDLEIKQILHIYEGIGFMISEEKDENQREIQLQNLMQYTQEDFAKVLETANNDSTSLQDIEMIKMIAFIIKANERVASSLGYPYYTHLGKIFQELLQLYKCYSQNISFAISNSTQVNISILKAMRTVRREILNLVATFVSKSTDWMKTMFNNQNGHIGSTTSEDPTVILSELIPKLSELIEDYNSNVPNARDPEVLSLFATLVKYIGDSMNLYIPDILNYMFESTLSMISNDFTEFMDFRRNFFRLIQNIIDNCLDGLFNSTEENFKICIDSIIWAVKHYQTELADIGLDTMNELLSKVVSNKEVSNVFFGKFYMSILEDTFFVLTDSLHKSGFYKQALIIMKLIAVVENEMIDINLSSDYDSTKQFVIDYLANALVTQFSNTNKVQIETFVLNMFNKWNDRKEFVNTMRDFLIWLKEYAGDDKDDLYKQEQQEAIKEAQEKENVRKQAIPGLIKPEAFQKSNGTLPTDEDEEDEF